MKYKLFFDVVLCDRLYSNFMRGCDLGIEEVGTSGTVSFTTSEEPTEEYIEKMIKHLESTKQHKELEIYYACVKHTRTEMVENE